MVSFDMFDHMQLHTVSH